MFADSLSESAPPPGHRGAWTKLVSTLLQATALAIALTIPLFHLERLHIIPPPPSIQIGAVTTAGSGATPNDDVITFPGHVHSRRCPAHVYTQSNFG